MTIVQGPSLGAVPLTGHKRRWPEQAIGGWASLPTDMIGLVTDRLLDSGDIVDYVVFRAVCYGWHASTPSPRERDPALRDPRLRPRGWIALCGGDAVRPDDAGEIDLFHTRTARRLRVRVPNDLRDRRIIGFSDGLLVLVHKTNGEILVLNPFTHVTVNFPSLASVYPEAIQDRDNFLGMKAAVCNAASSASSIAVVIWFPHKTAMVAAEACLDQWEILYRGFFVSSNTLVFQGRLYASTTSLEIVQLYPPTPTRPPPGLPVAVAQVPNISDHLGPHTYHTFLAESGGQMLLVVSHRPLVDPGTNWWEQASFTLYEVDLSNSSSDCTKLTSLHDRALFLSDYGSVSVSAMDLPSLSSNSIYFSAPLDPLLMHSLTTGLSEDLAAECQIHDGEKRRIRPSVRPFTIIDHLLTFCHPKEWTEGLMFHEYHIIPILSFKELLKKIWAKEWQLRIPPVPSAESKAKLQ